jgi:hypothetical protein
MSNLQSARAAIQAELEHARKGAAFYQSQVTALEQALETLDSVSGVSSRPGRAVKKTARSGRNGGEPAQASGRGRRGRRSDSGLPSTAGDFWKNLIKDTPQSAPEVLNAAIEALDISPDKDDRRRLVQRMVAALNHLVKTGAIKDSGSGRARRFIAP